MKALLTSMDCWNIAEGSEKCPAPRLRSRSPPRGRSNETDRWERRYDGTPPPSGNSHRGRRRSYYESDSEKDLKDWKKREARGASEVLYYLTDDVLLQIRDVEGL
jgi:phosphatidylethanolamine-binding protein (PEBP) family uncharacterized protein